MKKVCFIVPRFHPVIGGTEALAKNIIEFYGENNGEVEIHIITQPCFNRDKYLYPIKEIQFSEKEKLNSFIKKSNFELCIFVCDLHTPYLANYDFQCRKNLCILNLDETTYNNIQLWNLQKSADNLLNFDICITFTKDGIANKFLQEKKIKNLYIQNFSRDVLLTKEKNNLRQKLFNNNDYTILYNAAFEERKNQHNVLLKIKESKVLKDNNWIFIGSHPSSKYLSYCVKILKEIGEQKIKFIKPTTDTDTIDQLYQCSDLVMLTSIAEGMPLVLLESLSAGLPWISTDVGGVRGVLGKSETGVILDNINFSQEDLEVAIMKAKKVENKKCRLTWEQNFVKNNVLVQYKVLFDNFLGNGP